MLQRKFFDEIADEEGFDPITQAHKWASVSRANIRSRPVSKLSEKTIVSRYTGGRFFVEYLWRVQYTSTPCCVSPNDSHTSFIQYSAKTW